MNSKIRVRELQVFQFLILPEGDAVQLLYATCQRWDLWQPDSLRIHDMSVTDIFGKTFFFVSSCVCEREIVIGRVVCVLMFFSKRQLIRANAPFLQCMVLKNTRSRREELWGNKMTKQTNQKRVTGTYQWTLEAVTETWTFCRGTLYAKIVALRNYGEQRQSEPHLAVQFLNDALMALMLNDPCNALSPLSRH